MRKAYIAVGAALCLALAGCSPANQDTMQQQVDGVEDKESSDVRAGVIDYIYGDEIESLSKAGDYITAISNAAHDGDHASASQTKDDLYDLCNEIIGNDDIPEPCKPIHDSLSDAAESLKEAAYFYTESTSESDGSAWADYMSKASGAVEDASMSIDEATMHIEDVKDEYGI